MENEPIAAETKPSVIRVAVDGYGEFRLTGTSDFIEAAGPAIQSIMVLLIAEHVRLEVAKGRDEAEVVKEFEEANEAAWANAKAQSGEYKTATMKV